MGSGEELLKKLDTLRESILTLGVKLEKSGIERTNGLREARGDECTFYRRSLDIFLQEDYEDLRDEVYNCAELFKLIEGPNGTSK